MPKHRMASRVWCRFAHLHSWVIRLEVVGRAHACTGRMLGWQLALTAQMPARFGGGGGIRTPTMLVAARPPPMPSTPAGTGFRGLGSVFAALPGR
jgi:hypothetical protein